MNVSTLIYTVREDWSEQTAQIKRDQRRINLIIIFAALAGGLGVAIVDRAVPAVAWRSFLSEALSLCLYAAIAVWCGLRLRPQSAWRVALAVYLSGLAIMGVVDYVTKRGLTVSLVESTRASDPVLWFGALMLAFLLLLGAVAVRYPVLMNRVGLGLVYPLIRRPTGDTRRLGPLVQEAEIAAVGRQLVRVPQLTRKRLGQYVLAGLGVGVLISLHFWLSAKTAGMQLSLKPWPYMAWQFFYELGPQSLPEELFLRGVVFNHLYFGRGWNFWAAALTTSSLELLSLLVKQQFSGDVLILMGTVFYTVVSSVASAGLFRWSRSVLPGYVNNVVFSVVSTLR